MSNLVTEVLFVGGPLDHETRCFYFPAGRYTYKKHWYSLPFEKYNLYSIGDLAFYFYAREPSLAALERLTHQYKGGKPPEPRMSDLCLGGKLDGRWVPDSSEQIKANRVVYDFFDIRVDNDAVWVYICNMTKAATVLRNLYEDYKK